MSYTVVGSAPAFSNLCLAWVQDQLGIAHEGATAIAAWSLYSGRGWATASPSAGDLVFFSAGAINGYDGHVGIIQSDGTFKSVLSDGSVVVAPVGQFAADNGVSVLDYIHVGGGSGGSARPATSTAAAALPAVVDTGTVFRYLTIAAGGLLLLGLVDQAI